MKTRPFTSITPLNGAVPLFTLLLLLGGCEGPPGQDGADGSPGPTGVPGQDGEDGQDGDPGQDGPPGPTGVPGEPGENGQDGEDGEDGEDGQDGEDGMNAYVDPKALTVEISEVNTDAAPVVTFTVTDEDGAPFPWLSQDLLTSRALRMGIAKLVPAVPSAGGPDHWQSYINTSASTAGSTAGPDGVPVLASAIQATTETSGTLTHVEAGTYTYTFKVDVNNVTTPLAVPFEGGLLHRVAMQLEYPLQSGEEIILNELFDWVPDGGVPPVTKDVAMTESCNECHNPLAIHGGGRIEVGYCVTCHNAGTTDPNSGNVLDMSQMVHKIHMGHDLPSNEVTGGYTVWGFNNTEYNFGHIGYPQDQRNCAKCHSGADELTPDGDNWNTRPSMEACGSCHDDVVFATGENHGAPEDEVGPRDNSMCAVCHTSSKIKDAHTTLSATENNPEMPDGAWDITYQISAVSVDESGHPVVDFSIFADGEALNIKSLPSDLTTPNRWPAFLVAYALPQDGHELPADYNNLGTKAGQPVTVALNTLLDGTNGSVTGTGPVFTATLTSTTFPEGSTLRAVGLQGSFSQVVGSNTYARYAPSVVTAVAGDPVRREVVEMDKCLSCHEQILGHGGSRVNNPQMCATCHNPNLSSSGTELNLEHPEAGMNLRDLIHGIHGAEKREYPLDFVRNRNGGIHYTFITEEQLDEFPDGTVVTYPGDLSDCLTCHIEGTYGVSEPGDGLMTTWVTTDGVNASTADVVTARTNVPNDTDLMLSPQTSACMGCHNNNSAQAHMEQNGGVVFWTRAEANTEQPYETCEVCHGEGRVADVDWAHGL